MIKKYFIQHPNAVKTPALYGKSSFIRSIAYDKSQGTLFVNIGKKIYNYQVPIDLADKFSLSTSWGKFYDTYIKNQPIGIKTTPTPKSPKISEEKQSKLSELVPDTIEEWVGLASLGIMAIPMSLPLSIASVVGLIGIEAYLASIGKVKPKEYDYAIYFVSGYSLLTTLATPLRSIYSVFKSPFGNVSYIDKEGALIASMSKVQATRSILKGGKLLKDTVSGRLAMKKASDPVLQHIFKVGSKDAGATMVRTKAPISVLTGPGINPEFTAMMNAQFVAANMRTFRSRVIEETIAVGVGVGVSYAFNNQKQIKLTLSSNLSSSVGTALGVAALGYGAFKGGKFIYKQPKFKSALGKSLIGLSKMLK